MTAMLPEDVLGDSRMWDNLLRRIAERVSTQVLADLSVRIGEHLNVDLMTTATRMSEVLAAELRPILEEMDRAHALITALREEQANIEHVLAQFGPAMDTAVADALAVMDKEIQTRRRALANIAGGESVLFANTLTTSLLRQAVNDARALRGGIERDLARLREMEEILTTLTTHRSVLHLFWFGEPTTEIREAVRTYSETLSSLGERALPTAGQLERAMQGLWASIEPFAGEAKKHAGD